jgi:hypothetical protein
MKDKMTLRVPTARSPMPACAVERALVKRAGNPEGPRPRQAHDVIRFRVQK